HFQVQEINSTKNKENPQIYLDFIKVLVVNYFLENRGKFIYVI
ncbi:hypothetical protein Mgra_00007427, partial [Meloidogyne graminicola]